MPNVLHLLIYSAIGHNSTSPSAPNTPFQEVLRPKKDRPKIHSQKSLGALTLVFQTPPEKVF